jgi:hypothetical protein
MYLTLGLTMLFAKQPIEEQRNDSGRCHEMSKRNSRWTGERMRATVTLGGAPKVETGGSHGPPHLIDVALPEPNLIIAGPHLVRFLVRRPRFQPPFFCSYCEHVILRPVEIWFSFQKRREKID